MNNKLHIYALRHRDIKVKFYASGAVARISQGSLAL